MLKLDLQYFGGRGASGTLKNSNGKVAKGKNIVEMNGRTYRVNGTKTITFPSGKDIEIANAEFLYKGEWHKVKNNEISAKIAEEYKKKKR